MTNEEKREVRDLYGTLAARNDYPMPAAWEADRPAIAADADNALTCLRGLVVAKSWPWQADEFEAARETVRVSLC